MKRMILFVGLLFGVVASNASTETIVTDEAVSTELSSEAPASVAETVNRVPQSESTPEMEAKIREVAKKRLYPGGMDEEDLKVQAQLYVPEKKLGAKKKAPTAEAQED